MLKSTLPERLHISLQGFKSSVYHQNSLAFNLSASAKIPVVQKIENFADLNDIVGIEPVEGDVWKMVRALTNEKHRASLGSLGCSRNLRRSSSGCDLTHQVLGDESKKTVVSPSWPGGKGPLQYLFALRRE